MTLADSFQSTILKRVAERFLLLFFLLQISACSGQNHRQQWALAGSTMGTTWSVKIIIDANQALLTQDQVYQVISDELQRVDQLFSTYRDDSELSRFNRSRSLEWIQVSADFVEVMTQASTISQLTQGAFDVTVAPLVNLWGFGPDPERKVIPDQRTIQQVLRTTGYQKIEIDHASQRLRKLHSDISIDLSAIAKGYAVDQVALSLVKLGLKEYLVEVGGELRAKGHNRDDVAWRVGIEVPTPQLRQVYQAIQLVDQAVATSGDYRNYFEIDGKRFAHTINPLTGRPVEHGLASVTVIADSAMQADGWATALMVLGLEQGRMIAEQHSLPVLFISRSGNSFTDYATTDFKRR